MADSHRRTSTPAGGSRRHPPPSQQQQPGCFRSRAPASLQINRPDWKVAIPLLTPLVSPSSPKEIQTWAPNSGEGSSNSSHHKESEPEKPPVFKKWQHPAAPFQYDSGPMDPRFVPA